MFFLLVITDNEVNSENCVLHQHRCYKNQAGYRFNSSQTIINMTARILSRYLYESALRIARATAVKPSYLRTSLKNITYTYAKPQLWASHRLFSQKTEEMIVDYDHVKKATSNVDIYIVDVREPEEIKEHGKIPNSVNIPLGIVSTVLGPMAEGDFEKTYKRSKPAEEDEIIFYCMIGKRSGMAQQNALNLGYKNVKNYVGSWTDWASKK